MVSLSPDSETVHHADLDVGGARAGIRGEIGPAGLRTDMLHRHRLDAVADAVDVEPDLVTDGDVGDGGDLECWWRRPRASAPRKACVPRLPTAVTVATS